MERQRPARVIPHLLAVAALLLLATPGALAQDSPSHFAPFAGVRVHYESYGEGREAVVFIHGWTCDLTFWRAQAPVYGTHRSLLIDLPGHGQSDMPKVPYPVEYFARSIEAVMRDAGVDRATLVGHSLGGPIAYTFLRLYPAKTKALVLVDALVSAPASGAAVLKAQKETYARRARNLSGAEGDKNFGRQIDAMFSDLTPPDLREQIRVKMFATPEHVRVAAVTSASKLAPPPPGETYKLPALAIQAAQNGTDLRAAAMRKIFPQLRVVKWEGHGHFLMMEDPARFNQELEEFLAAQ
jgi:pimeloyl-ACP methyl ester carboxylesterase